MFASVVLSMAFACVWAGTTAVARDYQAGAIKIVRPWTRTPPAAAKVAGGYMTLINTGTTVDRLIGGSIANAARVEVHEMSMTDGVMRMRPLPAGLEIKPGETVVLQPGAFHLMFMDRTATQPGQMVIQGTLLFEKAGMVEIEYAIEAAGAKPSSGKGGKGSGSGTGEHGSH
jgi:periplasmic copper chaperone A